MEVTDVEALVDVLLSTSVVVIALENVMTIDKAGGDVIDGNLIAAYDGGDMVLLLLLLVLVVLLSLVVGLDILVEKLRKLKVA